MRPRPVCLGTGRGGCLWPLLPVLLPVLLLAASTAAASVSASWQYHLELDDAEILRMQVCAPAGQTLALQAYGSVAVDALLDAQAQGWQLQAEDRRLRHPSARCASYRVDLGALADQRRSGRGWRVGQDLLTWPSAWLWWPQPAQARIELRLSLPPGWSASTPWPSAADGTETLLPALGPRQWPALVAFGPMRRERLPLAGGQLEVALLGELAGTQGEPMLDWLRHLGDLLAPLGGLPQASVQVLLVPVSFGRGPVPWAQVQRGGLGGLHFFVNPAQPLQAFYDDWTGAHEFSHLLHPYLGGSGRWMAEGLASYYQNVLRARHGQLSEAAAWERLLAGFERGRRDPARGPALRELSRNMHRERAHMRVYWSGAAWWLERDLELRLASAGDWGLDRLLAEFARQHLPSHRRWSSSEFAAALDAICGHRLFAPAVARAEAWRSFPEIDPWLLRLGIHRAGAGGTVELDSRAELAALRRAIMAPRPDAPRSGSARAAPE